MLIPHVSPRVSTVLGDTPPPPTGHESPGDARDGGWLGQVPPSTPPTPPPVTTPSSPYANPHLAPDPWLAPPLEGTDPTLFG
ncbi:MAG: hypothetical protein JWM25_1852 [Thermoleophilia bacterium]|nr:hypothetical protein [Thermoleophilia bacterium]MCZ4497267.1 hypothetical protein [Thermoleophilia bacterium]